MVNANGVTLYSMRTLFKNGLCRCRYKYMIYYAFCLAENTALLVVWGLNTDPETWYFYPGVAGHYLAFFLGLAFMVTYYGCFHPSGRITHSFTYFFFLFLNEKHFILPAMAN